MLKYAGLILPLLLMLNTAPGAPQRFQKYKKLEAYEVRPGIVMFPSYTADDRLCEIALERLHYTPEVIRLDSNLSRKEIDPILDELVPADERGPQSKDLPGGLITYAGNSLTETTDFENVQVQIYGGVLPERKKQTMVEDIVATVKWKKRVCR